MSAAITPTNASPTPLGPPAAVPRRARRRHPVLSFLARRIGIGLITLLVISFLIFAATNALPGSVAEVALGKQATPANVKALNQQLGLDEPFLVRYGDWVAGMLHGDLGQSATALASGAAHAGAHDAPVIDEVRQPLLDTFVLAAATLVLLVPLAVVLGVIAAVRSGRLADYGISFTVLVLGAFPEFVLGTLLIFVFFSQLGLLPPVALIAPGESPLAHPDALVLPILTLLGVAVGFAARQIRAGVIESLRKGYVAAARLNGIPERRVLARFAIRNALAPSVQALAQTLQYLIGGIIVVESLYAYPGIGSLLVQAVSQRDETTVASVAVILAAAYLLINVVADLIVVFLVPKLRTSL